MAQAGGKHGQRIFQALRNVDFLDGHLVHVGIILDGANQIEDARRGVDHGLGDPLRAQRRSELGEHHRDRPWVKIAGEGLQLAGHHTKLGQLWSDVP